MYGNEENESRQYAHQISYGRSREHSVADARSTFLVKTYLNLTGAVLAFAALTAVVFAVCGVANIAQFMQENMKLTSLILLALCLVGPTIGNHIVGANPSRPAQYGLLGFYVLLYTAIFLPILTYAMILTGDGSLIWKATGLTGSLFVALSAAVFLTRADFSFLRSLLVFTGFAAMILIVASFVFGFNLGVWFSVGMIFLACGFVLYDTSNLIYRYGAEDHVFAAISLFSSLMTLFYYILRILMAFNRR